MGTLPREMINTHTHTHTHTQPPRGYKEGDFLSQLTGVGGLFIDYKEDKAHSLF